jgi:hypothetical protein
MCLKKRGLKHLVTQSVKLRSLSKTVFGSQGTIIKDIALPFESSIKANTPAKNTAGQPSMCT